ncbi:MAG: hypothetical protein ACUVTD_08855, partial [Nitrososphaerales archaeon]
KQLERLERNIKCNKNLSKRNKKLLLNFADRLLASGISKGRVVKYLSHLAHRQNRREEPGQS